MCSIGESKKIIVCFAILVLFMSCRQSFFDVITQNDVGYWTRYWSPSDPNRIIREYSQKDSIMQYLNGQDMSVDRDGQTLGDIYGIRFKYVNDTLLYYVRTKRGFVAMYDTIPIASYSRNKIVLRNGVVWHRIPKRIIKKKRQQLLHQ